MSNSSRTVRDVGTTRLRRLTRGAVTLAVLLGGAFAGLAAASTHITKKTVVRVQTPQKHSTATVKRHRAVTAPVPPLVAVGGGGSEDGASAPPSSAPSPAGSAPAPTVAPPVVVSGGS